jgi:enoyl-CoA hydratase
VETYNNLMVETRDGIAYITVNRPNALNALNQHTLAELDQAFAQAKQDNGVHGVILTGGGDKAFVAGADIAEIASVSAVEAELFTRRGQRVMDAIEALGKPVIAAVNGYALGGGCELALACTLRLAVDTAKFGQPEVKLGVTPGFGGTQRLPRLVGKGHALQLILTGEPITASEAYRIGLVNELVPADRLIARAEEILSKIASNAPLAVRFSLEAVRLGLDGDLASGLSIESAYFAICASSEDKREGTSAFLQKRAPKFVGV